MHLGNCTWGMNCRFIHPGVNDKGNYSLISKPDPFPPNGAPPGPGGPHPLLPNNPWVCFFFSPCLLQICVKQHKLRIISVWTLVLSFFIVSIIFVSLALRGNIITDYKRKYVFCFLGWASSGGAPSTTASCGASCGECLGERTKACQRGTYFPFPIRGFSTYMRPAGSRIYWAWQQGVTAIFIFIFAGYLSEEFLETDVLLVFSVEHEA